MRIILAVYILLLGSLSAYASGIPTFDGANVAQTTITAQNSITQTAQQLKQYQTQLQQLENQIQNTANPSSFQWDNANNTINKILSNMNTLNTYENQAGGINSYLNQFSDASHYQNSSCIKGGCTAEQMQQLNNNEYTASQAQKMSNDDMFKNILQQQQQLKTDAANLTTLQHNAQDSKGQMQAIQAANQLASNQAVQLMQIRSLLISQQTAEVTRAQILADREAKQKAAHDIFVKNTLAPSQSFNITDYTRK